MNKKAIFLPLFVLLTMLVSAYLGYTYISNQVSSKKISVIDSSAEIVSTYEEGESKLFYIEQSAKLAAWKSLSELGTVSDFDSEFKKAFNSNLNSYLEKQNLPKDNYDYTFSDSFIIGKAKQELILEKKNRLSIKYTIAPSFKISIPILSKINEINNCKSQNSEGCIKNLNLNYSQEGNYLIVDIPQTKNLYTDELINLKIKLVKNQLLQ